MLMLRRSLSVLYKKHPNLLTLNRTRVHDLFVESMFTTSSLFINTTAKFPRCRQWFLTVLKPDIYCYINLITVTLSFYTVTLHMVFGD